MMTLLELEDVCSAYEEGARRKGEWTNDVRWSVYTAASRRPCLPTKPWVRLKMPSIACGAEQREGCLRFSAGRTLRPGGMTRKGRIEWKWGIEGGGWVSMVGYRKEGIEGGCRGILRQVKEAFLACRFKTVVHELVDVVKTHKYKL